MEQFFATVNSAFETTRRLLWPFRRDVWLKLFFLMALSGGVSSSWRIPAFPSNKGPETTTITPPTTTTPPASIVSAVLKESINQPWTRFTTNLKIFWAENRRLALQVASILAAIVLLVAIMFMWLSTRLQFVAYAALNEEQIQIKKYWIATERLAESYFRFQLLLSIGGLTIFTGTLLAFSGNLIALGWPPKIPALAPLLLKMAGLAAIAMPVIVALTLLTRYLPVVMIQTNETVMPALRRSLRFFARHPLHTMGLVAGVALIGFAVGIAVTIVMSITGIFVALIGTALALVVALAGQIGKVILLTVGTIIAIAIFFTLIMIAIVPARVLIANLRLLVVRNENL